MAKYCNGCGTAAADEIKFCGKCGAAFAAGDVPAGGPPAPPPIPQGGSTGPSAPGLEPNLAGALSYALGFITGILFLVLEPYNKDRFVRFHAWQSIATCVALVVANVGLGIVLSVLWRVTFGLAWFLWPLWSLAEFLLWLFLMYKAYQNERHMIPYIGELAVRQAGL